MSLSDSRWRLVERDPPPAANYKSPVEQEIEGFLALLAARRSQRTVEAYRRDLADAVRVLDKPLSTASTDDLERYLAELRSRGLAAATVARRLAALRSFYRHLVLIGPRHNNPAAELRPPRRQRRLPHPLSPAEAERLIEAAAVSSRATCATGPWSSCSTAPDCA